LGEREEIRCLTSLSGKGGTPVCAQFEDPDPIHVCRIRGGGPTNGPVS